MSTPKSFRALAQEMRMATNGLDSRTAHTYHICAGYVERLADEWEQEIADQRGDLGQVYIQQLLLGKEKP